jgi:EAL domain-containing protein (putative c-di-GMP-specific phosphodiesterase class I)
VAIDNIGTGYSSLSYLERLPIEVLEIDRSFTAVIGHGRDVPVLVRSIVELGQSLRMEVLAEGSTRPGSSTGCAPSTPASVRASTSLRPSARQK